MSSYNQSLQRLLGLIREKRQCLEAILEYTKKQGTFVDENQIDMMIFCIEKKQENIEIINRLDEEFDSLYKQAKPEIKKLARCGDNSEEHILHRELCDEIAGAQEIMEDIYRLEQRNVPRVQEYMDIVKEKIRNINTARRGYNAYKRTAKVADGVFIDKKK